MTDQPENSIPLEETPAGKMIKDAENYFRTLVENPHWQDIDFSHAQMQLDGVGSGFYYNDWTETQVKTGILEAFQMAADLTTDFTYEYLVGLPTDCNMERILALKEKSAEATIEEFKVVIKLCETLLEEVLSIPRQATH